MKDLRRLLLDEAGELLDAEKQLVRALPQIGRVVSSLEVQSALENHLEQTQDHVDRLKRVFSMFGTKPRAKASIAMTGLVAEALEWAREEEYPTVKDTALILAIQKIEHYEIASYGGLRTWADLLGKGEAARLLNQTCDEEKEMDNLLNDVAGQINVEIVRQGKRYGTSGGGFSQAKSQPMRLAGRGRGR